MTAALVTGCASPRGIGLATAARVARQGWHVAVLARVADPLHEAVELITRQVGRRAAADL